MRFSPVNSEILITMVVKKMVRKGSNFPEQVDISGELSKRPRLNNVFKRVTKLTVLTAEPPLRTSSCRTISHHPALSPTTMLRRFIPRLRLFKTFSPVYTTPILPLTSRVGLRSVSPTSLTRASRPSSSRLFSHFSARLSSQPPQSQLDDRPTLPPDATLSQRLKFLIKSYGWYALGMYLVLSAVDFGIAFAGVNLLGAEHVSRVAASVKSYAMQLVYTRPLEPGLEEQEIAPASVGSQEGLYAMLVLAYTIHKTLFLPVRVGLTAALTPRLVGWLGRRGWAGKEGTKRGAKEMRERIRPKNNRPE